MRIISVALPFIAAMALVLSGFSAAHGADAQKPKQGKLLHVVAFKFKDSATNEQIKKVETAFTSLPRKISQIEKLEWGTNNSPEKLNKGCTHGFILTFKSEKDRDDYLVHPAHKEFGSLVGPLLDDVFVIDFWTQN